MAIIQQTVSLTRETVARIQNELRVLGIEGWLLYDFRGLNQIACGLLGLPGMSRRYFVLIPAEGEPVALTHAIEQQPWGTWIGENRPYSSWRALESELARLVGGRTVAMEYDPGDAVPYIDRVPAGVVEMARAAGATVATSADLVSAFYSRWSPEGEAAHRRAAIVLQEVAHEAFARIGELIRGGAPPTEWEMRGWIRDELVRRGLKVGADDIVAIGEHAANPHYSPTAEGRERIGAGDLVLIDLWGKESEAAIYADQTWMGYVGNAVPAGIDEIWRAVRDARDAAVALIRARWAAGEPVAGYEADDAAREVIRSRGYADNFIHRTGHSIDTELHGSGPNIDGLETRDTRRLIAGVGFSIEPGIYLPGDVGFRSEIDVFMGSNGPEVTTPAPQREIILVGAE